MEELMVERVKAHLSAFCAQDWDAYKAGLTPDAVYVEPATGRAARGADAYIEGVKGWMAAFPDMQVTFERTLACGDTVVAEVTWAGTQTGTLAGPLGEILPTGKYGTLPAVVIATFAGDKIKEVHQYFDLMTLLRNLGALPTPAAAAA